MAKEKPTDATTRKPGNAYVTTPFRDFHDFDISYEEGQDVTDHARLDELITKGVVEVHPEPEKPVVAPKPPVAPKPLVVPPAAPVVPPVVPPNPAAPNA